MEFREAVRRRRMVRNYTDEPVERERIERIVGAARRAPSAGFSQGTRFVVITSQETRTRLARLAGEEHYVQMGLGPWLSRAPVHVVLCVRENDYHERYREPDKLVDGAEMEWPVPFWWVDAGAALMTLLLAAVDEGLAAGVFGAHRLPEVRDLLGLPEDFQVVAAVTIGHPAPDKRSGSLARGWRPVEDVVRWERWS